MLMVKAGGPLMDSSTTASHLEAGISLSTGEIRFSKTLCAAPNTSNRRSSIHWYWRIRGRTARGTARASCPAVRLDLAARQRHLSEIAAKVEDGTPCCDWVGENGAGHYVKRSTWN